MVQFFQSLIGGNPKDFLIIPQTWGKLREGIPLQIASKDFSFFLFGLGKKGKGWGISYGITKNNS